MSEQPPKGFYGSDFVPAQPRKSRVPVVLIVVVLLALFMIMIVGGAAAFWMVRAAPPPPGPFGDVPEDGNRYYRMSWSTEGTPVKSSLRAAWISGQSVHAVGDEGTILTRDPGGAWTAQTSGTKEHLRAITSTPAGMMAVGDNGTALVFDRATRQWNSEDTGTKATLRALMALGPIVYAVGDGGNIVVRSPEGTWRTEPSGTNADLYGLSSSSNIPSHMQLYAFGTEGTILYRAKPSAAGESPWVVQASGTKATLRAARGELNELLAVGDSATALRLRTQTDAPWANEPVAGAPDLFAATFTSVRYEMRRRNYSQSGSENCWLVAGQGGYVAIRPQSLSEPWQVLDPKPTSEDLFGVAGTYDLVVLVGANGTIVTGRAHP